MRLIHVGAAVLNQTPLDWDGNLANIRQAIEEAKKRGVSVLCLPELCLPGYGCDDFFHAAGVQEMSLDLLGELLPASRGLIVSIGLPVLYRKALFNCAAVLCDGELLGFVAKRYLPGDGLYYEPRWFKAWPEGRQGLVEWEGQSYPIGDLVFEVDGVGLGFEICEEAWVGERTGSTLSARGVDLMLNPSASHFAFGKHATRRRFVLEGSRAFGVTYVFSNVLGNSSGRMIFDGGAMIASGGRMVAEEPRFSFRDVVLTSAVVDVDSSRLSQLQIGSFLPDFEASSEGRVIARGFRWPDVPPPGPGGGAQAELSREEEFTRATTLGLFDYLRKSRSRGCVVSLSGGADSAATASLVSLMLRGAANELGLDGLLDKLSYLDASNVASVDDLVRQMLLCVYQSTRNSSQTTLDAARSVAEGIGAEFVVLDVDAVVETYREKVEAAIGRPLTWQEDDLTLQNIQARSRAPSVWMFANLRGALLLSTSNRSEAAVGYATMDGDTAGGLSPIAGIDKAFLRRWLRWLEEEGPAGLGTVPALAAVNQLAPTAELRPQEDGQTDEDDLMPYDVLDIIERQAIGRKKVPLEVFESLRGRFPDVGVWQLGAWIERFFRLWARNQWKRERYAPSFHVDDENLDPKTWCRFPILSGGFDRELRELRRHINGLEEGP